MPQETLQLWIILCTCILESTCRTLTGGLGIVLQIFDKFFNAICFKLKYNSEYSLNSFQFSLEMYLMVSFGTAHVAKVSIVSKVIYFLLDTTLHTYEMKFGAKHVKCLRRHTFYINTERCCLLAYTCRRNID